MAASLLRQTFDPCLPFSRAEARSAGISMTELAGPRFQRIFYNLYVSQAVAATPLLRARAALKVSPQGSHASHFTAGEIWGGWVPDQPQTHLSSPREQSRCQRRGVRSHDINDEADVVTFHGIRVSSPTQTFLDLAAVVDLVDLVVFGDSMVRAGRSTVAELVEAADAWAGRGRKLARRAARLVREGVDSPMESRLRMLIVLAGLPEPKVNIIIRNQNGEWLVRFDLCYPGLKIVVEYDGRQHAEDHKQWDHDIDRREQLDRWGYRLVVVRSKGVYVDPERTLRRIRTALRERGCQTLPRRFNQEWKRYFPGRPAQ
jgi:very-short-patch-repair endonuclease